MPSQQSGVSKATAVSFRIPCCRPVAVLVRPSLGRRHRPSLAHNTTTPSPHCAARVLSGRSADTARGKKRAGRAPRKSNAVATAARRPCRRSIAVLVEPRLGRKSGEERAPRWPTKRLWQVRNARRAYSMDGRPILHGTKRTARATRHGIRTRWPHKPLQAVPRTCGGVGTVEPWPTAWGVARPALAHHTTIPSPQSGVWRVLHGRSANTRRGEERAGRAPLDSNEVVTTFPNAVLPSCRGVGVVEPRPTARGGARPASGT